MAELLIDEGADINVYEDKTGGTTPLLTAILHGSY